MKNQRIQLWVALVCLAIGAFMLHYRIHPPQGRLTYFWASFAGGLNLVLVSLLFLFKRTALWGLLLNSFLAYIGIIMMTDYTITLTLFGKIPYSPFSEPLRWFLGHPVSRYSHPVRELHGGVGFIWGDQRGIEVRTHRLTAISSGGLSAGLLIYVPWWETGSTN